jgi:protein gp37
MGEATKIQWCDATFNPWRGCTKISAGCANCYAETQSKRNPSVLGVWGDRGTRVVASETMWRQPLKWDREAKNAGERRRVFCASLADVFEERPELVAPRQRLFELIGGTRNLDWLLLTKRPEVAVEHWPLWSGYALGGCIRQNLPIDGLLRDNLVVSNIWLGVSVENRATLGRIDVLRKIPAAVRFLSLEPLLEDLGQINLEGIHWVIIGGESGSQARPCHVEWIRSLVGQCQAAGVPCFTKQLGKRIRWMPKHGPCGLWPDHVRFEYQRGGEDSAHHIILRDPKGGDPEEWATDLRVRAFPMAV